MKKLKLTPEPAMLECEIREWKILTESPVYEISNDGRLRRRTNGSNMKAGTLLRATMSKKGYPKYNIVLPCGREVTRNAHRMVATEFLEPPPPGKNKALHDDDNRLNCRVSNLKWGSCQDNISDAFKNGLIQLGKNHSSARKPWHRPRGEDHVSKKLTEDQVISIFSDSRTQRSIAQEYGVNQALIQRIKKGKVWKHITNPEYAKMLKIGASSEGMI